MIFSLLSVFILFQDDVPTLRFSPVPAWVTQVPLDPSEKALSDRGYGGISPLLLDRQEHAPLRTAFFRYAYRIENAIGLQQGAQVTLTFHPTQVDLHVHGLTIHRDGQQREAVPREKWRLIQQETELDRFLYNGTYSAIAFLEDVRVGDTVEVVYSLVEHSSLFGEKFWAKFPLIFQNPYNQIRYRVLVPSHQKLSYQSEKVVFSPVVTKREGLTEYLWHAGANQATTVSALEEQNAEWLVTTLYQSWLEVQSDLAPWYQPLESAPWLDAWIAELKMQQTGLEAQVLEAIRFVQDDVRYLGIEIGSDSQIPSKPEETFQRRFGDCKDKTMLLAAMLKQLGLEPIAVLVDSMKRLEKETLPNPFAFDHVVLVFDWQGTPIGIDSTQTHERGGLLERDGLPFGYGLFLNGKDDALRELPYKPQESLVKKTYQLQAEEWLEDAFLTVETAYYRKLADSHREQLQNQTLAVLSEAFLGRYTAEFPGIEVARPLEMEDDEVNNILTVKEFYRIPKFGEKQRQEQLIHISAHELFEFIGWPDSSDTSWRPNHPIEAELHYQLKLPVRWSSLNGSRRIDNALFRFEFSAEQAGQENRLRWLFKSKKAEGKGPAPARFSEDVDYLNQSLSTYVGSPAFQNEFHIADSWNRFWSWRIFGWDSLASICLFGWAGWFYFRVRNQYRRQVWSHWLGQSGGSE